mmetsp:Transcript_4160/g.7372  ORF Transcript_4160/g.7372 Transcript_4160/m.7372 type:complete len:185 (-) Transcript_4160:273-827(-)
MAMQWQQWNRPSHGRKGFGKGQLPLPRNPESRIDPEDKGSLPMELLSLSRQLAALLRHRGGCIYGLEMDDEGWTPVHKVLALEDLRELTLDTLRTVVQESVSNDKPCFEIKQQDHVAMIRACHKRGGDADAGAKRKPRQRWQPRQSEKKPQLLSTISTSANDEDEEAPLELLAASPSRDEDGQV